MDARLDKVRTDAGAPEAMTRLRSLLGTPADSEEAALSDALDRLCAVAGEDAAELAAALALALSERDRNAGALRDPLTGLYGRRFHAEALAKEANRHHRYGTSAALVLFDIDELGLLNSERGQETGDRVLVRVAEILDSLVRPSDIVARTGGGRFALLLPETTQLDALLAAERLRTAVSRHRVLPDRQVTISGGVAALPEDGVTVEELERKAEAAVAWAKANGRNMCAVAREIETGDSTLVDGMLAHLHAVVAGIDGQHLLTRDHSENVAAYAVAIAQSLGLDEDRIVRLRRAAFLHDIGKIAVPAEVLNKAGRLTEDEYDQVKIHPEVGGHMLTHAGLIEEAGWVRHHHERFDGGGYPDAWAGERIALESRILFVADSFEAMTSDRPYRLGMPIEAAVAELRRCAGTQFDPAVVEAITGLLDADRLTVLALRRAA